MVLVFPMTSKTIGKCTAFAIERSHARDLLFWGTPDLISNAGVYLGGGRYLTVDLMGGIVMIQTVSKTWEPDFVGSLR
ncbi:Uncharacterised protein [Weissella viridescens]|uniref:Uncharacterized protein n=1 Tax=Weissella viridescens TaxID=1629 RepID=A0A380NZ04_WEIVI|nr:Uncharacterised protein [Weissella viridescens]